MKMLNKAQLSLVSGGSVQDIFPHQMTINRFVLTMIGAQFIGKFLFDATPTTCAVWALAYCVGYEEGYTWGTKDEASHIPAPIAPNTWVPVS